MDKKIIGYKPKPGVDIEAAAAAIGYTAPDIWKKGIAGQGYAFGADTGNERAAMKRGVLDLLFEPVYEQEKPLSTTLTLGSEGTKIEVWKDGAVRKDGNTLSISDIKEVYNTLDNLKLGTFSVNFQANASFYIGCGEGEHFTINDLKEVIDAHAKLQ